MAMLTFRGPDGNVDVESELFEKICARVHRLGISAKGNILIQTTDDMVLEAVGGEMFHVMREEILKELETASAIN